MLPPSSLLLPLFFAILGRHGKDGKGFGESVEKEKAPCLGGGRPADAVLFVPLAYAGKPRQRYKVFGSRASVCATGFSGDTAETGPEGAVNCELAE
jgi:hypothetical protein